MAKIYTFDCTGTWPAPSFVDLKPWCVGGRNFVDESGRIFKTYQTILTDLGLTKVDYLKMDIEGFEWSVAPSILKHSSKDSLPKQISFELHLFPTVRAV